MKAEELTHHMQKSISADRRAAGAKDPYGAQLWDWPGTLLLRELGNVITASCLHGFTPSALSILKVWINPVISKHTFTCMAETGSQTPRVWVLCCFSSYFTAANKSEGSRLQNCSETEACLKLSLTAEGWGGERKALCFLGFRTHTQTPGTTKSKSSLFFLQYHPMSSLV